MAAPAAWGDLSAVTLTLYNGGTGPSYAGPTPLSSFTRREINGGRSTRWTFRCRTGHLTAGSGPVRTGAAVLELRGSVHGDDGMAAGLESTDIGVYEPAATPLGSTAVDGHGDSYGDFTWRLLAGDLGTVNERQSMFQGPASSVPEPAASSGG